MILRKILNKFRKEMVYDFQHSYGLSLYDVVQGSICFSEFYDLVEGLMETPGTKLRASGFNIEEYSLSDRLLVRIYNGVISGLDAKPNEKRKMLINFNKPVNSFDDDKQTEEPENRKMNAKKAERVKVAKPGEKIPKYHIDKEGIVRQCKKYGIDCTVAELHFGSERRAKRFKENN